MKDQSVELTGRCVSHHTYALRTQISQRTFARPHALKRATRRCRHCANASKARCSPSSKDDEAAASIGYLRVT
eukprot:5202464-Prymnesium_polylepis.1